MPVPTTTWICDTCGFLIEAPDHGWVEWITVINPISGSRQGRDIRIVHHAPHSPGSALCQFNSERERILNGGFISDFPLCDFLGDDGLMYLLEMITEQYLPASDVLEIIKRIHISGYEHARRHIARAQREGLIERDEGDRFLLQNELQLVLDFAAAIEE